MKNIVEVYDKQSDGSKDIGEVFELMQKVQISFFIFFFSIEINIQSK